MPMLDRLLVDLISCENSLPCYALVKRYGPLNTPNFKMRPIKQQGLQKTDFSEDML